MGQYLCIGLRTALTVERTKLELPFMSSEEVQRCLEEQLVPQHLYKKVESEKSIHYYLQQEAVCDEFVAFLREFYRLRYDEVGEKKYGSDSYIELISQYDNLEQWISLANQKCMEGFQSTRNYNSLRINDWRYLDYKQECIVLSFTGKVWMECYGAFFQFILNCIKSRLSQFKLKDTLSIFISQ